MTTIALDLDGTLITAEAKQTLALRSAARGFGIDVDAISLWAGKRNGLSNREYLLKQGVQECNVTQICARFQMEVENAFWLTLDVKFDDTDANLEALLSSGFHLHLLTARSCPLWLYQQLRRLDILHYFEQVFVVNPSATVAEKCGLLRRHGAVVFVGDSESDAKAAELAGVSFAATSTGQRSELFLRNAGVPNVCASLTDAINSVRPRGRK